LKSILNYIILLTIFLLPISCSVGTSGKNFVRPSNEFLILEKTTTGDIVSRFGLPLKEETLVRNGERFLNYGYIYTTTAKDKAIAEDINPQRAQFFYFSNDKLVGYEFFSSFREDNTDFDITTISQIRKGISTRSEVERLFGPPGGKAVYPLFPNKDEEVLIYFYSQAKGNILNLAFYRKYLKIACNRQDIVTNIEYTESGQK
jgi:hypothetical protein